MDAASLHCSCEHFSAFFHLFQLCGTSTQGHLEPSHSSRPLVLLFHLPGMPFQELPSWKTLSPSRDSGDVPSGQPCQDHSALLSLSGPRSQVNCWHLLYCGIYVSLSPLDSRLPEGKISLLFISVSPCSVQAIQ